MFISILMLFRTHLMLGIIFFLLVREFLPLPNPLFFLALVLLGSLLPDIDEGHSVINRWSGALGGMVAFLFKHRGLFHSLFLAVLLSIVLGWFTQWYLGFGLFLGYAAHLFGDSFTVMGIKPFYPFSHSMVRGPVRVGGWMEWVLFLVLVVLVVRMIL